MTLEEKLQPVLDWFKDCDAVPETVKNMNRELASLGLVAHLDDRVMVIRRIPTQKKPKPSTRKVDFPTILHTVTPCP